jgi:hypothetical protein
MVTFRKNKSFINMDARLEVVLKVTIYNLSGRIVWSGMQKTLHKGSNSILCSSDEFGTGVYIAKVTRVDTDGRSGSAFAQTVALINHR